MTILENILTVSFVIMVILYVTEVYNNDEILKKYKKLTKDQENLIKDQEEFIKEIKGDILKIFRNNK
ncbi:hypothetical protein EGI16_12180 [Chryseobacterium sp. G0240]|uniref:hypothetical protein n=1 Tax=Chryseobacterium sp. G0240 TaxID=2487066 RepID=UPI000F456E79|nr:hypothetical protein [Chryseobacterium sp. G0240]ROI02923.1 hypothetical protein EGI16_12180 [Chryseobacterium sp. G0240]